MSPSVARARADSWTVAGAGVRAGVGVGVDVDVDVGEGASPRSTASSAAKGCPAEAGVVGGVLDARGGHQHSEEETISWRAPKKTTEPPIPG
ncbi:hypothetical protein [Streptomyces sp. NBC_00273]|uniref:hypothetical protein n=1 Tax=Streptomyces sp. NBC_00273 TaxID=2903644 RepID=UPI002E2C0D5C|nr:hypothetical protein [Streptomyces sp. NBC_00273]